jgi:hypothetical protein
LVLVGYFWPPVPFAFQDYVGGDPNSIRARLKLAASYGPSSYKFGAKVIRVLCPVFTVVIAASYLVHAGMSSRRPGLPGRLETETVFELILLMIVGANILIPIIITY